MSKQFEDALRKAEVQRKSGDALRTQKKETDAVEAFEKGARLLNEVVASSDLKTVDAKLVAEAHGALGGILRRLDRQHEALAAYKKGAEVETERGLESTYNRLNWIKYRLFTGERLATLEPEIKSLAAFIEKSLTDTSQTTAKSQLRDSGWAWADLADCNALLGDLDKAEKYYITFIEKSETKSPKTALDVLKDLAKHLESSKDPDAERVRAAATSLARRLGIQM